MTSAQCQQTAADWINRGNDFVDKGFYDLAIKCYDEAIRLDPNSATAWNNRGNILNEQGDYEDAIRAYDEAITLDPNNAMAWSNKGCLLKDLGEYGEAIKVHDEAIRLDPNNAIAWYNKGLVLDAQLKYDDAIKCYDEAIRLDPKDADAPRKRDAALKSLRNDVKSRFEDYNASMFQSIWMYDNREICKQLTHDQAVELLVFRESNAETAIIGSGDKKSIAESIVSAIDDVFEANLDGSPRAAEMMNSSLKKLHELAPDKCANGTAIYVLAENYKSYAAGGKFVCNTDAGQMCYDGSPEAQQAVQASLDGDR